MYQGVSDRFYGPTDDVRMPDEALQIDFEGEFGVIVDAVPMGTAPRIAASTSGWSCRSMTGRFALAGPEMKSGFGVVQAKPPCPWPPLR
jgi:fumarylacetoacetate (FAA) hydrolase